MTQVLEGDPLAWSVPGPTAISIGVFDGVHRGHRSVIERLLRRSRRDGLVATVLTFHPHPLAVVDPGRAPALLTTVEQRIELLEGLGVQMVGVLPFDRIRDMEPETFAQGVLSERLDARLVAVGTDFRFGHDRAGDVDTLRRVGQRCGYEVVAVELLNENDHPISSTRIRRLIAEGKVGEAADILERPYEIRGRVVAGDGRGRTIGIPTANLDIDQVVAVPGDGVYAAWAVVAGSVHPAVVNIGVRPTFDGDRRVVEAHLIGFDGDLYGQEMRLRFVSRLRGERRFRSVDDLVDQIRADAETAREVLSGVVPEIDGDRR